MEQKNGPIVHVRADSDSTLDDLFAVVTPCTQRPLQVPMKMRNLPPSFWNPPPSGGSKSPSCHSRENSVDNTLDPMSPGMQSVGSPQPAPTPQQQQQQQQQQQSGPFHSRAHSSPATLQQTLAVAQQQSQHLHLRQPSYDVSAPGNGGEIQGPLPPGWEMAKTPLGQVYFMNHISKSTQWEDPRKTLQQQQQLLQQQQQQQQQQIQQQQQQQQLGPPSSPQPPPIGALHPKSPSGSFDNLGALPQGWEQSITPEGEVYFINHASKKTTWFDPRVPLQNQRVPIRSSQQQQQLELNGMTPAQKRQQEVRLQRLENERRALHQRQGELLRLMERRSQSQENMQAAMNQTQEMLMRQSLGENTTAASAAASAAAADPFLSTASPGDLHNRQESADSGVGMGSNFNLGSIPEDLPDDMDSAMDVSNDLDTTLTDQANMDSQQQQQGSHHPLDATDQLIPSLPAELGEVLSQDIMQDVLGSSRGGGVLTWL